MIAVYPVTVYIVSFTDCRNHPTGLLKTKLRLVLHIISFLQIQLYSFHDPCKPFYLSLSLGALP